MRSSPEAHSSRIIIDYWSLRLFWFRRLLLSLVGFISLNSCNTENSGREPEQILNIAVAANMSLTMDSLAVVFSNSHTIDLKISSNSSGMLTSQIMEGAPFDVFVSANLKYPEKLIKEGLADEVVEYARGRLVIAYRGTKQFDNVDSLLFSKGVRKIGVANTVTAPFGIASLEFLDNKDLRDPLLPKIVYGESISQVNQYIQTSAVDAIFTSNSFRARFPDEFNYLFLDDSAYAPIKLGVCALERGLAEQPEEVKEFVTFMQSDRCRAVLDYFGYITD